MQILVSVFIFLYTLTNWIYFRYEPPPSPAPFNLNKKGGSEEIIDLRKERENKFFFGDDNGANDNKVICLIICRARVRILF